MPSFLPNKILAFLEVVAMNIDIFKLFFTKMHQEAEFIQIFPGPPVPLNILTISDMSIIGLFLFQNPRE